MHEKKVIPRVASGEERKITLQKMRKGLYILKTWEFSRGGNFRDIAFFAKIPPAR